MKTFKVLDINCDGLHLACIFRKGDTNPFRVYRIDRDHKRQIAKYGDFFSVICFIHDLYKDNANWFDMSGMIAWCKERGCI